MTKEQLERWDKISGWTWETVGAVAKESGFAIGKIACPRCGIVASGAITPDCPWCDKPYWPPENKEIGNGQV